MSSPMDTVLLAPPPGVAEGGEVQQIQSGWRLALREFAQHKLAVGGLCFIVAMFLFCFVGPFLYHSDQYVVNDLNTFSPPSSANPLGTDAQGFDQLGRIMLGGQASLEIGFLTAAIAIVVGTLVGAIAGLAGGIVDAVLMRVVDTFLSIPILFALLIVADATQSGMTVVKLSLLIAAFAWLFPARLVRGDVLALRVRDFVSAARVMGASRRRLVLRHLIPNSLGTVLVNVTFQVGDAIGYVAVLGFLGLGLSYPHTDWGDMLSSGVSYLQAGYWWLIYPVGGCLVATIMAFNLVGDGLRDAMDTRLRRR
jgi:ABC-type dipeptide/oligopeptide/nickel transport system permease subunit